jgi:hypothetical protein
MIPIYIDDKITQQAIDVFGVEKQQLKLAEECAECSAAVSKSITNPSIKNHVHAIEEIADALIMIDQALKMYPVEEIQKLINYKLNRLQGLIEKTLHEKL